MNGVGDTRIEAKIFEMCVQIFHHNWQAQFTLRSVDDNVYMYVHVRVQGVHACPLTLLVALLW